MTNEKIERINESGVETAKKIRKALKEAFPNVKFSVRSDYNSVNIHYTDAIPQSEVEAITDRFESGYFDGMQDMYINGYYEYEGKLYSGAKYIFVKRNLSDEYRATIEEYATSKGYDMDRNQWNYYEYLNRAEKEMIAATQEPSIVETPSNDIQSTPTNEEVNVVLNEEKQGIEITFASKPAQDILDQLHADGFKWYFKLGKWIAKQTPERIEFAYSLIVGNSDKQDPIPTVQEEVIEPVNQDNVIDFTIKRAKK